MAEIASPTPLSLRTQVLRFILTGGFSAVVDFGLYLFLYRSGLQVDIAKAIGFVAGTLTAYLINRRWTFAAAPSRARFAAGLPRSPASTKSPVCSSTPRNKETGWQPN